MATTVLPMIFCANHYKYGRLISIRRFLELVEDELSPAKRQEIVDNFKHTNHVFIKLSLDKRAFITDKGAWFTDYNGFKYLADMYPNKAHIANAFYSVLNNENIDYSNTIGVCYVYDCECTEQNQNNILKCIIRAPHSPDPFTIRLRDIDPIKESLMFNNNEIKVIQIDGIYKYGLVDIANILEYTGYCNAESLIDPEEITIIGDIARKNRNGVNFYAQMFVSDLGICQFIFHIRTRNTEFNRFFLESIKNMK